MYTYIESLNSTEARLNLTHTPPTYFVNVVDTAGPAETVQWALPPPPLCVEMGFTWTFPRNQDATVKLKSKLIFIKF